MLAIGAVNQPVSVPLAFLTVGESSR